MKQVIIILIFTFSIVLKAQITITSDQWQNETVVGKNWNNYWLAVGSQAEVNLGTASDQAQYWDFSTYSWELAGTSESITASTAPDISLFPNSTHVYREEVVSSPGEYTYSFNQYTSNELLFWGNSWGDGGIAYNPPIKTGHFPLTYGSTWTFNYTSDMDGIITTGTMTKTVDAFGTMKLPEGEYAVLRVVTVDNSTTSVMGYEVTGATKNYAFYTQSMVSAVVTISEGQEDQTTVTTSAIVYSMGAGSTDISEESDLPLDFNLHQSYPNPFNPSTTISFNLPSSGYVSLVVYNLIGEKVADLVSDKLSSGNYQYKFNAENLSSGVYIYRLSHNGLSLSKKCS